MINPILPQPSRAASAVRRPEINVAAAVPHDRVDVSSGASQRAPHMSTAQDVALLPSFDPAVGAVMIMASLALGSGASTPTSAALQPALSATLGNQHAEIRYTLSQTALTSNGTLAPAEGPAPTSNNISEHLAASGSGARLTGQMGDAAEDLLITPSGAGMHMTGKVGDVDVDLVYSLQPAAGAAPASAEEFPWASVQGKIGTSTYSATALLAPPAQDGDLGAITVRGGLDDQEISKSYRVTADPNASTLTIDGQGAVAGQAHNVKLVMDLSSASGFLPFAPHA